MKSIIVIPLILAAIVTATVMHSNRKITTPPEYYIGGLAHGFSGLEKVLPDHTNVSYRWVGEKFEISVYLWTRYLLAPRYCIAVDKQKPGFATDTEFIMSKAYISDSELHIFFNNKRILWSNRDTSYRYLLIAGK